MMKSGSLLSGLGVLFLVVLLQGCMTVANTKTGKVYQLTADGFVEKEQAPVADKKASEKTAKKQPVQRKSDRSYMKGSTDCRSDYRSKWCLNEFSFIVDLDVDSAHGRFMSVDYGKSIYTYGHEQQGTRYDIWWNTLRHRYPGTRDRNYVEVGFYKYSPSQTRVRVRYNPYYAMRYDYPPIQDQAGYEASLRRRFLKNLGF